MAHPDNETFCVEIGSDATSEDLDAFSAAMAEMQNEQVAAWEDEAKKLGIPFGAMADIGYLRTRSRWTQEKEDYLIRLAKEGKPLPFMMDDFEVPMS